jgi:glucose/arabinose dehydrogenase
MRAAMTAIAVTSLFGAIGCSLLFDVDDYRVEVRDAGTRDAGARDAAPRDGGPGCSSFELPALGTEPLVPGHVWNAPVFLTQPPGVDALFVVEQGGTIQIVLPGGIVQTFLTIPVEYVGEQGLLGLAFHPHYATNGRFFVYYVPPGGGQNIVSEYVRSVNVPSLAYPYEIARILTQPDPEANHNAGMLAFGRDGFLYVAMGDGGSGGDPHGEFGNGLDRTTLLGKILRLDVENRAGNYSAAGNPFSGTSGLPQIWAYGLRNPWRFSFDRETGDLYIADVGQNQWEEIDFQPAASTGGENYGWRAYEGDIVYDNNVVDRVPVHAAPVLAYAHVSSTDILRGACSVTGGYVYRGSVIPGLQGFYLFGDWCSVDVAAFKMCGGVRQGLTRVDGLTNQIVRLASFGEDQAGELYMLGSDVVRIVPR